MTTRPSGAVQGVRATRRALLALPFLSSCAASCDRTLVADLPLRLIESYPIVPASIAGQAVSLLLDTGAQGMLMTPAAAAALALPLAGMTRIYGTGGSQEVRVVGLPGLRLGGAPMPGLIAPVAPLPVDLAMTPPLAGLLGASLLARFDLDLDVPGLRLRLWTAADCPAPLEGTRVALEVSQQGEAYLPVRVNGQVLLALLDTGSRPTMLSEDAARRMGLSAPVSANTAPGVDGRLLPVGHLRVRLGLGDEAAADTPVSMAPVQLEHGDMLLGMDSLARRRIWVSYARREAVFGPPTPPP